MCGQQTRTLKRHPRGDAPKLGVDIEFGIENHHRQLLTARPISRMAAVQSNGARPA